MARARRRKRQQCVSCGAPLMSDQNYVCTGCAFLALFGVRKHPQVQEVIWRRILAALEAEGEIVS